MVLWRIHITNPITFSIFRKRSPVDIGIKLTQTESATLAGGAPSFLKRLNRYETGLGTKKL
jgi:hypothetical protein